MHNWPNSSCVEIKNDISGKLMSYIICGLWKLHITTRLWTPGAKVSSLGLNFFPLISAKTGMMPFLEAVSFISCPAAVALGSPWEPSNHQVGERRNWRVSPPHSPQITCTRLPHCWGTNRLHLLLGQKNVPQKIFLWVDSELTSSFSAAPSGMGARPPLVWPSFSHKQIAVFLFCDFP